MGCVSFGLPFLSPMWWFWPLIFYWIFAKIMMNLNICKSWGLGGEGSHTHSWRVVRYGQDEMTTTWGSYLDRKWWMRLIAFFHIPHHGKGHWEWKRSWRMSSNEHLRLEWAPSSTMYYRMWFPNVLVTSPWARYITLIIIISRHDVLPTLYE